LDPAVGQEHADREKVDPGFHISFWVSNFSFRWLRLPLAAGSDAGFPPGAEVVALAPAPIVGSSCRGHLLPIALFQRVRRFEMLV